MPEDNIQENGGDGGVPENRGVQGIRILQGLLTLPQRHPSEAIEKACQTAATYGSYRLKTIRKLIKRAEPHEPQLTLLEEHPIIRSMEDYGDVVRASLGV